MAVEIAAFVLGPVETNCYLLASGGACWVIDAGMEPQPLLSFLAREELAPGRVILTHGHCDHIGGAADLKAAFPDALLCCPAADADMLDDQVANLSAPFGLSVTSPPADVLLAPGEELVLGRTTWQILDTSGHTPGGVSLYCPEEAAVFTGDALFARSIGRFDIPGADGSRLIENIRKRLLTLPDETRVYPGHGSPTTIGEERRLNPYL
jgi:hydroxyacylglutathione hydrolase